MHFSILFSTVFEPSILTPVLLRMIMIYLQVNNQHVSTFVTAGNVKFMLLHSNASSSTLLSSTHHNAATNNTANTISGGNTVLRVSEDSIKYFFQDVYELYVKVSFIHADVNLSNTLLSFGIKLNFRQRKFCLQSLLWIPFIDTILLSIRIHLNHVFDQYHVNICCKLTTKTAAFVFFRVRTTCSWYD